MRTGEMLWPGVCVAKILPLPMLTPDPRESGLRDLGHTPFEAIRNKLTNLSIIIITSIISHFF